MPYISKMERPMLNSLLSAIQRYPDWKEEEHHYITMNMLYDWLIIKEQENPEGIDGIINYICTRLLKHIHGKESLRDSATAINELLNYRFERMKQSYFNYQRVYGLLSLMEVEFDRRGWATPQTRTVLKNEKAKWKIKIGRYEDTKIEANGDVE